MGTVAVCCGAVHEKWRPSRQDCRSARGLAIILLCMFDAVVITIIIISISFIFVVVISLGEVRRPNSKRRCSK